MPEMHFFILVTKFNQIILRKTIIIFWLVLTELCPMNGQSLENLIREFRSSPALKGSVLGVQIVELDSGNPVLSFQSETRMMPASTQKLLFTLAALDQLGADYVFHTKLFITGKITSSGTLKGDFLISSSGDPGFASNRNNSKMNIDLVFQTIHKTLNKLGIKQIDGRLVLQIQGDTESVSGSWHWEDLSNYYGGGAWGFNFLENEYSVYFKQQAKVGQLCQIERIFPEIPGLKLTSRVFSGPAGSGDQAYIMGGPEDLTKTILGTIPAGKASFRVKGSIPDPPVAFLRMLKVYLDKKGIPSQGMKIRHGKPPAERLIGKFSSGPLRDLARECNFHSINLYAESFGRAMLLAKNVETLSGYPGPEEWKKLFESYPVGVEDLQIRDACGLSQGNLITPDKLTRYIVLFHKKLGMSLLKYILPRAGMEGTVKNFLENHPSGQNIWLKSGSIEGVLNYTGIYRSAANGKYYAFAVMVNHSISPVKDVRQSIEQFLVKAMNIRLN